MAEPVIVEVLPAAKYETASLCAREETRTRYAVPVPTPVAESDPSKIFPAYQLTDAPCDVIATHSIAAIINFFILLFPFALHDTPCIAQN